jgi:two-component system, OmpR family, KDP operon response regulator KdpE
MGASVAGRRTRVVVMTSEVELMRLVRSVLEPSGCLVSSDGRSLAGAKADAHFIVVCGGYREADCIAVLDLDADYLPRPFRARDLAARVRVAELRRFNASVHRRYYRHGSFVIDLFNRRVALEGEGIALASSEMSVLTLLASRAGHVAMFGRILAGLGRADSASGRRALRASVFRLRRKIERDPRRPDLLLTEAGVGYRLASETEDELSLDPPAPRRAGNEDASS